MQAHQVYNMAKSVMKAPFHLIQCIRQVDELANYNTMSCPMLILQGKH